jgi:hypothetical protein
MTAPTPPRPLDVRLLPGDADILRRAYRREPAADVLHRALRMLATADGHLDTAGRIITGNQPGRRT